MSDVGLDRFVALNTAVTIEALAGAISAFEDEEIILLFLRVDELIVDWSFTERLVAALSKVMDTEEIQ